MLTMMTAMSGSGVLAIGDVRAGSIKRVAAAVGEGAQVVAAVHTYLAQRRESLSQSVPLITGVHHGCPMHSHR